METSCHKISLKQIYVFREVGLSFKERSFPIKLQLEGSGRIRQDIDDMTIKDESLCVCVLVRECSPSVLLSSS